MKPRRLPKGFAWGQRRKIASQGEPRRLWFTAHLVEYLNRRLGSVIPRREAKPAATPPLELSLRVFPLIRSLINGSSDPVKYRRQYVLILSIYASFIDGARLPLAELTFEPAVRIGGLKDWGIEGLSD